MQISGYWEKIVAKNEILSAVKNLQLSAEISFEISDLILPRLLFFIKTHDTTAR